MMRVYISGKITGNPNYREEFGNAEQLLKRQGFRPLNPTRGEPDGKTWEHYMRRDIRKLSRCQGILMLDGWTDSRGATLEHKIAVALGMRVYVLSSITGETRVYDITEESRWDEGKTR